MRDRLTGAPTGLNPHKGADFEVIARWALEKRFIVAFAEQRRLVGHPPKVHRFDAVSVDGRYGECKNFSKTQSNKAPNGKFAEANMDVLHVLLDKQERGRNGTIYFLVMAKSPGVHPSETLADIYVNVRRYGHLLRPNIKLWELNAGSGIWRDVIS